MVDYGERERAGTDEHFDGQEEDLGIRIVSQCGLREPCEECGGDRRRGIGKDMQQKYLTGKFCGWMCFENAKSLRTEVVMTRGVVLSEKD